jgi:hypothetical protein
VDVGAGAGVGAGPEPALRWETDCQRAVLRVCLLGIWLRASLQTLGTDRFSHP